MNKQHCFGGFVVTGEIGKTKPISRLRIADCGLGTDLPRDAPCGLLPRACAGQLYKQTQLAGANRAKRTQFAAGGGWDGTAGA
jgi:hypothetical protein